LKYSKINDTIIIIHIKGDNIMTTAQTALYVITLCLGAAALCFFLKLRVKACSAKAAVAKSWVSVFFILSWLVLSYAKGLSAFAAFPPMHSTNPRTTASNAIAFLVTGRSS